MKTCGCYHSSIHRSAQLQCIIAPYRWVASFAIFQNVTVFIWMIRTLLFINRFLQVWYQHEEDNQLLPIMPGHYVLLICLIKHFWENWTFRNVQEPFLLSVHYWQWYFYKGRNGTSVCPLKKLLEYVVKGTCSDPQPHPPLLLLLLLFFKHGDLGTTSWVIFKRLYVWRFMHKVSV